MKSKRATEYDKLLRQAQKQPGLVEVVKVYGKYDALLEQSRRYLDSATQQEYFSAGTSTDQGI